MGRYGVITFLKVLVRGLNGNHGCTDHDKEGDWDPEGHGGASSAVQTWGLRRENSPCQRWGKNTFQENDTCYTYRKKRKKDNLRAFWPTEASLLGKWLGKR